MDTFEEDITNEKDLISKDDLEKSNSLAIKSLDETAFDLLEFLKEKYFLSITFKKSNNNVQISNKSIFKIFESFNDKNDKENLEEVLLNHITCTINEKDDFNTINHGIENSMEILDAPYVELLNKTNNYKINFNNKKEENKAFEDIKKNLLIYEEHNNKLNVQSRSIKKICKFLGKNIFDMSDYINIIVLYLNEDEINKDFIQNRIVDKYNKSEEKFYFLGNKKLETDLIVPEKNKKNSIYKLNSLFDKILIKIDNVDSSDLSDDNEIEKNENESVPKKYIDQKIKANSDNYYEVVNNKSEDEESGLLKDDKCNCQKDLCEICNIF
jgi:hypothetical protein